MNNRDCEKIPWSKKKEGEKRHFKFVTALIIAICTIISATVDLLIIVSVMVFFRNGIIYHLLVVTLNRPDLMGSGVLIFVITALVVSPAFFMVGKTFKSVGNLRTEEQHEKYRRKRLEYCEKMFEMSLRH